MLELLQDLEIESARERNINKSVLRYLIAQAKKLTKSLSTEGGKGIRSSEILVIFFTEIPRPANLVFGLN